MASKTLSYNGLNTNKNLSSRVDLSDIKEKYNSCFREVESGLLSGAHNSDDMNVRRNLWLSVLQTSSYGKMLSDNIGKSVDIYEPIELSDGSLSIQKFAYKDGDRKAYQNGQYLCVPFDDVNKSSLDHVSRDTINRSLERFSGLVDDGLSSRGWQDDSSFDY